MDGVGLGIERHDLAGVVVGVSHDEPPSVLDDRSDDTFDVLVTSYPDPPRPWVNGTLYELQEAIATAPEAALVLVQVLRIVARVPVPEGLVAESMAYSMLQSGEVFRRWLAQRPTPPRRVDRDHGTDEEVVQLERDGARLEITLTRPRVHNALNAAMRDALVEAFELVLLDDTITEVHLRGRGPSFCSGGDLDEFGLATNGVSAHHLRIERSVARRLHECSDRVVAHLHGACVGAGIEMPSFAGRVVADPDSRIRLPELSLGLIPGAGGTVGVSRRIGRSRTAWLALTGRSLDAGTALRWGLVDHVAERHKSQDQRHDP